MKTIAAMAKEFLAGYFVALFGLVGSSSAHSFSTGLMSYNVYNSPTENQVPITFGQF